MRVRGTLVRYQDVVQIWEKNRLSVGSVVAQREHLQALRQSNTSHLDRTINFSDRLATLEHISNSILCY